MKKETLACPGWSPLDCGPGGSDAHLLNSSPTELTNAVPSLRLVSSSTRLLWRLRATLVALCEYFG